MRQIDYPTPYDKAIENLEKWMEENNPSLLELSRTAQSTLSYKYHMLCYPETWSKDIDEASEKIQNVLDGEKPIETLGHFAIQDRIYEDPRLQLDDAKWLYRMNGVNPGRIKWMKLIEKLEAEGR